MMLGGRTSLKDLIDAGLLQIGEKLSCEPRRGEVHIAVLNADGLIHYDGESFSSPFAWSTHLNSNKRDGWRTVHARGRTLRSFRDELENPGRYQSEEIVTQGVSQKDGIGSLRQEVLRLTPSEFQELAREYLQSKGFDNAEIEIVIRMKM